MQYGGGDEWNQKNRPTCREPGSNLANSSKGGLVGMKRNNKYKYERWKREEGEKNAMHIR